ncbi:GntR family transcriptional regulator [Murinocardiopsis flavida]|uniref:GntR family transcriptional regulator n=1 Tax=Murinocardiopsis flavida TaxID=645275 RepID=UPI001B80DBB1|nr:GntR family transcriptional regulator [Murinocardiopsis flavida]
MNGTEHGRSDVPVSLPAWVADRIRELILRGDLPPGTRLGEEGLSARFGVSRPPLREGLRSLETEGLVVQVPRRGTFVRTVTLQDAYEICTLRDELEHMAVRLGVPVHDAAAMARCREAMARLAAAAAAGDSAGVTEEGFGFHLALVGLSGHGRLEAAFRGLALQMRLCMAMNRRARRSMETLREDAARHSRILDLVEEGDPERVVEALAGHGHTTFVLALRDQLGEGSPAAAAWADRIAAEAAEAS